MEFELKLHGIFTMLYVWCVEAFHYDLMFLLWLMLWLDALAMADAWLYRYGLTFWLWLWLMLGLTLRLWYDTLAMA